MRFRIDVTRSTGRVLRKGYGGRRVRSGDGTNLGVTITDTRDSKTTAWKISRCTFLHDMSYANWSGSGPYRI